MIKSSNLGDTRTLAIPVAQTIFFELGAERRAERGIPDTMIRLSVGIEDTEDPIGISNRRWRAKRRYPLTWIFLSYVAKYKPI